MHTQEINNQLDDLCQKTVNNLPRVIRELESVKQESIILRDKMQSVKMDICKVERDTSQSMKTLLHLDTIKSRMNDTSAALQESDNWTTLAADIEQVFLTNDVDAITKKLEGLQNSLQMLPDLDNEKSEFLSSLKNRLEALLSTQVIQAFSTNDIESTKRFSLIFESIGRTDEFRKYYNKCHKVALIEKWVKVQTNGTDSGDYEQLRSYFDLLLEFINVQSQWCAGVFSPVTRSRILLDLVTAVIDALQLSLTSTSRHASVTSLVIARHVYDSFADNLGISFTVDIDNIESLENLSFSLYKPFRIYVYNLNTYVDTIFNSKLKEINFENCDIYECETVMSDSIQKLFDYADLIYEDSLTIGSGYALPVMLKSYKNYFTNFACKFRHAISSLSKHHQRSLNDLKPVVKPGSSPGGGSTAFDIGEMNSEWSLFQECVRIVQITGKLVIRMEKFAKKMYIEYNKYQPPSLKTLCSPTSSTANKVNPFKDYWRLFVSSGGATGETTKLLTDWSTLVDIVDDGGPTIMLSDSLDEMKSLSVCAHQLAFHLVTEPVKLHFKSIHEMPVWFSETDGVALISDLPSFSLSPQEYITKIGQYLMTLPLHFEVFSADESNTALCIALQYSNLPYYKGTDAQDNLTNAWMESITQACLHSYVDCIQCIPSITAHGSKQLLTDMDYVSNVTEDLGMSVPDSFALISSLLSGTEQVATTSTTKSAARLRAKITEALLAGSSTTNRN